jgi:hypothetical protein
MKQTSCRGFFRKTIKDSPVIKEILMVHTRLGIYTPYAGA